MSDQLSQDQLDSLLSQGLDEGADEGLLGGEPQEEASKERDYSVLRGFFELVASQAATVVSTVLNNPFSMQIAACGPADPAEIRTKLPQGLLSLQIDFTGGLGGPMHVVIAKSETARLSDLMMMGDGNAEYAEDHKDAICELFNQIMGAFVTAASDKCEGGVTLGGINAVDFDWTSPPYNLEGADMVLFTMAIGETRDLPLCCIVPAELAAKINEKCTGFGQQQETAAPASSVGLNMNEITDLSSVTSDMGGDDGGGFRETSVASSTARTGSQENVDMLLDVELDVSIELGRTMLSLKKILELAPDAIVELDRMAGEPVDLMVNNKVVARGEVVVVDENFGVRIVSLVSPEERIKSLR
jgi:flagellar motor switch protein FliN/FliY